MIYPGQILGIEGNLMLFGRSKKKKAQVKVAPQPIASSPPEAPRAKPPVRAAAPPPAPAKKLIGQLLVEAGHISPGDLTRALERQKESGGKLVEVLIDMGSIDRESFQQIMAKQPGIASIDLENYSIPPELASLVPREMAIQHEIYPIDKLGKLLTLGMACPLDTKTIEELTERTGLRVKPILCSHKDIQDCIAQFYVD